MIVIGIPSGWEEWSAFLHYYMTNGGTHFSFTAPSGAWDRRKPDPADSWRDWTITEPLHG